VPVNRLEPPVLAAYQLSVPALAVALSATVPGPQLLPAVVEETVGIVFTVAKTELLAEVHPLFVALT
jgi:hypothetical protein